MVLVHLDHLDQLCVYVWIRKSPAPPLEAVDRILTDESCDNQVQLVPQLIINYKLKVTSFITHPRSCGIC